MLSQLMNLFAKTEKISLTFSRCFSGWEGAACDRCQPLPGCANGDCVDHPNTCECNAGWTGHLCDVPECK